HLTHLHRLHSFSNDTPTTAIYTLSLHDALPISRVRCQGGGGASACSPRRAASAAGTFDSASRRADLGTRSSFDRARALDGAHARDRKSTRLNSSHVKISYAVFCLKKKMSK